MHRIQRKPSSETLTSVGMDSTIDSRMSSAEVPQMELLKVNYVHQCKEAFMTKTGSVPNYNFMEFKKCSPHSLNGITHALPPVTRKNIARVTVNRLEAPNKPLPPPPPTVESWQFLQNSKRTTNSPPKFIKPPQEEKNECSSSSSYCATSYDGASESDATLTGDGVKSNSWNYRNKMSTCDIRRDMARAGIKSRADRIARIERTECEHSKTEREAPTREPAIERNADSNVNPKEAVAKINQMFEAQKQIKNFPPQPNRPAPVPHKEPNRRLKPTAPLKDNAQVRSSLNKSNDCSECSECSQESSRTNSSCSESCSLISQETVQYRRSESKDRRAISRIPKPIADKHSSRTTMQSNVQKSDNERSKRNDRIQKSKSIEQLSDLDKESKTAQDTRHSLGIDQQLLRNTRISVGNYQKAKVERVHIRKKRQPLLIINQLNEPELKRHEEGQVERKSTCGYKNCSFDNCPMSPADHENKHKPPFDDDCNKLKRLSLESNSDSGVSSSHDFKDDKKRISQLKNIDKCSDVKQTQKKALNKSEHFENYAYEKFKSDKTETAKEQNLTPKNSGSQVKIVQSSFNSHYNTADPNDVSNFAKKNLTKATTNEALNNSSSLIKSSTKQCNIENEQRLKYQNNLQKPSKTSTTHIKIEDDWVKEEGVEQQDDYIECDSLMITEKPIRKPINSNDNAVKIFVRSSQLSNDLCRSSCASANSFVSQTSVCTQNSTTSNSSLTSSSVSSVSSSGCGSSNADNQSLCDSERDCCCQLTNSAGMFFNRPCSALSHEHQRLCAGSPLSSTDAISDISSCVTCSTNPSTVISPLALANTVQCCNNSNGVFWNNSYMSIEAQDENNLPPCCCSVSSCDDDNCSYYEGDNNSKNVGNELVVRSRESDSTNRLNEGRVSGSGGGAGSDKENKKELNYQKHHTPQQQLQMRNLTYQNQHPTQQQQQTKRNVRNSSAEEILIRNKLLRKVSRHRCLSYNLRLYIYTRCRIIIYSIEAEAHSLSYSPRQANRQTTSIATNFCKCRRNPNKRRVHLVSVSLVVIVDSEARRLKRGHVLSELLETERIYVSEMSSILKGYCDQMHSEEMIHLVPASLQGKEDILFGNLHELYTFHNDVFLKDLENCISTTELVALCFVQRRDTFYRLYSFYCQNIPRSDRLRETLVDTHLFLQECQKRLGHKLPLAAYLLKPVQRITKYQLLLKDLLRFSDSGSCTKELQKALDCMLIVLKCVNDSMHQVAITGFPTDLSQQGELLLQDSFQVWSESKKDLRLRIKPQQRHIFLYQKSMLFCKQTSKPGHNKSTYQFKHYLKFYGSKFVALADYVAVGHSEVSMREGDNVELLKVGCAGWWYVRILDTSSEGWTPAAYLESINRKSSRSSSRNQERLNLNKLND
ncbi:uncharacterized protein LOC111688911 [Lucilia cuprina]|uniref:uncharacterized protein LOC111688911 n=1 Tax=Lucilia cuprina TaxID=7375 RepID=UPI001F066F4B|nr:uncharacterized protein LOC111688911 [Lucilia cuprina]